jgi:hypothetical protein
LAADDVDGAGGVDHGRVLISRIPSRAGRAARPRDTCGRTRATTKAGRTEPQPRARPPTRGADRAINTASHRRAMGKRAQRGGARTRRSVTHAVHARAHRQTKRRARAHTHTHTQTRTHTQTHTHTHQQTRGRARRHASTRTQFLPREMQCRPYMRWHRRLHVYVLRRRESGTGEWSETRAHVGRPGANPVGTPRLPLEYPHRVPPDHPTPESGREPPSVLAHTSLK